MPEAEIYPFISIHDVGDYFHSKQSLLDWSKEYNPLFAERMIADRLLHIVACPYDGYALAIDEQRLACKRGHPFPVYRGIPVLLRDDVDKTMDWQSLERLKAGDLPEGDWSPSAHERVHPVVQLCVSVVGGSLYKPLIQKLKNYPIPHIRLPNSKNDLLLDVGCNWGRWSIAASRRGYEVVGLEPDIGYALTAQVVASQLGVKSHIVVGDARYLPFLDNTFDRVFSYSVIQHFSKEDARVTLREIARTLKPKGEALIQMPNKFGIRSVYHQARARFREQGKFNVRYWSPKELRCAFESTIGPSRISADGFFGLGIQPSDWPILPRRYWPILVTSEMLRRSGLLTSLADSLYVSATKLGLS